MKTILAPLRARIEQFDRSVGSMDVVQALNERRHIRTDIMTLLATVFSPSELEAVINEVRFWNMPLAHFDLDHIRVVSVMKGHLEANLYEAIAAHLQEHMDWVNSPMVTLQEALDAVAAWDLELNRLKKLRLPVPREFGLARTHAAEVIEYIQKRERLEEQRRRLAQNLAVHNALEKLKRKKVR